MAPAWAATKNLTPGCRVSRRPRSTISPLPRVTITSRPQPAGGQEELPRDQQLPDLKAARLGERHPAPGEVRGGFRDQFRRDEALGLDLPDAPAGVVEEIQAKLQVPAHEAGLGRHHDALPVEFAPHHEVRRLHDLEEQEPRPERVHHAPGHEPGLADRHRDRVEAGIHRRQVLPGHDLAPPVPARRPLKAEPQVPAVAGTDAEDDIALQLAVRQPQLRLRHGPRRVHLRVQAHRRIDQLGEESEAGAVLPQMLRPQVKFPVLATQVG